MRLSTDRAFAEVLSQDGGNFYRSTYADPSARVRRAVDSQLECFANEGGCVLSVWGKNADKPQAGRS